MPIDVEVLPPNVVDTVHIEPFVRIV